MGKRKAAGIKEEAEAHCVSFVLQVFIACSQITVGINTVQKKRTANSRAIGLRLLRKIRHVQHRQARWVSLEDLRGLTDVTVRLVSITHERPTLFHLQGGQRRGPSTVSQPFSPQPLENILSESLLKDRKDKASRSSQQLKGR